MRSLFSIDWVRMVYAGVISDRTDLLRRLIVCRKTIAILCVSTFLTNAASAAVLYFEDFESTAYPPIWSWKTRAETGNPWWALGTSAPEGSKKCAQATGGKATGEDVSTWLVSPPLDLSGLSEATLTYYLSLWFATGGELTLWGSTNYNVNIATNDAAYREPWEAEWIQLPLIDTTTSSWRGRTNSLGVICGYSNAAVAFRYNDSVTGEYSNARYVDQIRVSAPQPPTVTTESTTNISYHAAHCLGNVTDDGGAAVTARGACWSTSTNPTLSDASSTNGGGTGSYTADVTGLTPSTRYYVCAFAVNGAGASYGDVLSFDTEALPAPAVLPADLISEDGFEANWSGVDGATGYELDVSTDSGFGSYVAGYQARNNGTNTGMMVTGLTAQTPYFYQVRTVLGAQTSPNSTTESVTTWEVNVPPEDLALSGSSVDENEAAGALIGYLSCVDTNEHNTHTYDFATGAGDADNGSFTISGTSLLTSVSFDYEAQTSATVRIEVSDGRSGTTYEEAFGITIYNLNDNPPVVSDQTRTLSETAPNLTWVVTALNGSDADGDTLSWAIAGGTGANRFRIDTNSAQLQLTNNVGIDYESGITNYSLLVSADDGLFSATGTVTIALINENDNSPVIGSLSTSIWETATSGTVVGTLSCSDADGDPLTFSITAGNIDGVFGMGTPDGAVIVTNTSNLDFESGHTNYLLDIRLSDGIFSATGTAEIVVMNANEGPPIMTNRTIESMEAMLDGYPVGAPLTATDPDGEPMSFSMGSSDDGGIYGVTTNGQLYMADNSLLQVLEGQTNTYHLNIEVTDGLLSSTGMVTIVVPNQDRLIPHDAPIYRWGIGVEHMSDDRVFVSASEHRNYVFERQGAKWVEIGCPTTPTNLIYETFFLHNWVIAARGNTVIFRAYSQDTTQCYAVFCDYEGESWSTQVVETAFFSAAVVDGPIATLSFHENHDDGGTLTITTNIYLRSFVKSGGNWTFHSVTHDVPHHYYSYYGYNLFIRGICSNKLYTSNTDSEGHFLFSVYNWTESGWELGPELTSCIVEREEYFYFGEGDDIYTTLATNENDLVWKLGIPDWDGNPTSNLVSRSLYKYTWNGSSWSRNFIFDTNIDPVDDPDIYAAIQGYTNSSRSWRPRGWKQSGHPEWGFIWTDWVTNQQTSVGLQSRDNERFYLARIHNNILEKYDVWNVTNITQYYDVWNVTNSPDDGPNWAFTVTNYLSSCAICGSYAMMGNTLQEGSGTIMIQKIDGLKVSSAPLPNGVQNSPYHTTVAALFCAYPLNWTATNLPDGLSCSIAGVISGTPTVTGTYAVAFNVVDDAHETAGRILPLTIYPPPPSPLSIQTATLPDGFQGEAYSNTLSAAGGYPPYRWECTSGMPAGFTCSSNGVLSGIPASSGTSTLHIVAYDSASSVDSVDLDLVIRGELTVLTTSLPTGRVDEVYGVDLEAGGGLPPYEWIHKTGFLPQGVTISTAGHLGGTPEGSSLFSFGVEVSDSQGRKDYRALDLQILPIPVSISTLSLPSGTEGSYYSHTMAATNGRPLPTYDWSTTTVLPAGLSLSSGGVLSGTPTGPSSTDIEFTVEDSWHETDTETFRLIIHSDSATPLILSSNLPTAWVDQEYTEELVAVGGTQPYTWSTPYGNNAMDFPGLYLSPDGVVTGAPGHICTADHENRPSTVQVVDAAGSNTSGQVYLTIDNQVRLVTDSLPNATAGEWYSLELETEGELCGGEVTYSIEGLPGALAMQRAYIQGIPDLLTAGTYPLEITVQDVDSTCITNLVLTVEGNADQRPEIQSISPPLGLVEIQEMSTQVFAMVAIDPDGGELVYEWRHMPGDPDKEIMDWHYTRFTNSFVFEAFPGEAGLTGTIQSIIRQTNGFWSLTNEWTIAITAPYLLQPIPGGDISIGNPAEDANCPGCEIGTKPEEQPAHFVFVGDFWMEQYEVSQTKFNGIVLWASSHGYDLGPAVTNYNRLLGTVKRKPVTVSWYDAVKWCNARSEMEGFDPVYYTDEGHSAVYRSGEVDLMDAHVDRNASGYRLATEAEWEKAARGGLSRQHFPWASDAGTDWSTQIDTNDANYGGDYADMMPPGNYSPNGYGLYDMAGNADEWCWDWLDLGWYTNSLSRAANTHGPANATGQRVVRGGGSHSPAIDLRCSARDYGPEISAGIRCVVGGGGGYLGSLRAEQRPGATLVDVYYDLDVTKAVAVTAQASTNGVDWDIPFTSLKGDIGGSVSSGSKHFVWDAGEDWPSNATSQMQVELTAGNLLGTTPKFSLVTKEDTSWELVAWVDKDGNDRFADNETFEGAEVYYDGRTTNHFVGLTDSQGVCRIIAEARLGAEVFIRAKVQEKTTQHDNHEAVSNLAYTLWMDSDVGARDRQPGNGEWKTYTLQDADMFFIGEDEPAPIQLRHPLFEFHMIVAADLGNEEFFTKLGTGFTHASTYLYDVSDGQMKFGNIIAVANVVSNGAFWKSADMLIYNDTGYHPCANPYGLLDPSPKFQSHIHMGTQWGAKDPDHQDYYRTIVHEFGHYGLSFFDEYCNDTNSIEHIAKVKNELPGIMPQNHGFMDEQYHISEMSSWNDYSLNTNVLNEIITRSPFITAQVAYHDLRGTRDENDRQPCWEYLQAYITNKTAASGYHISICKPPLGSFSSASHLVAGRSTSEDRAGPTNIPAPYSACTYVISNVVAQGGGGDKMAFRQPQSGNIIVLKDKKPVIGATLLRRTTKRPTPQWIGKTDKEGSLFVYDLLPGDVLVARKAGKEFARTLQAEDFDHNIIISMGAEGLRKEVGGTNLYVTVGVEILEQTNQTWSLSIWGSDTFLEAPAVVVHPQFLSSITVQLSQVSGHLYTGVVQTVGSWMGTVEIQASSTNGASSISSDRYTFEGLDTNVHGLAYGSDQSVQFTVPYDNVTTSTLVMVYLGYSPPPPPAGAATALVGSVFSIAVHDQATLLSTNFALSVKYNEDDIIGLDVATAGLFKWNDSSETWTQVQASVSARSGQLETGLKELGIFAVFAEPSADTNAPSAIGDLTASSADHSWNVNLTWTAPGDDGTNGTALWYDLRYSTVLIEETNWADVASSPLLISPQTSGLPESVSISMPNPGVNYCFAIRAVDEAGNIGPLSNVAWARSHMYDYDGDGMMDQYEYNYDLMVNNPSDAAKDSDGDGLTNLEEHNLGTNPRAWDTDGDGMGDRWENKHGLNPRSTVDRDEDPDGDGLSNIEEHGYFTDPDSADSDGDGLPDPWEIEHGLNAISDSNHDGKNSDPDGDGFENLSEYVADTIPTNQLSFLGITNIYVTGSGIQIEWIGGVKAYQYLEAATNGFEVHNAWQTIFTNIPPTDISSSVIDQQMDPSFYRIKAAR